MVEGCKTMLNKLLDFKTIFKHMLYYCIYSYMHNIKW